MMGNRLNWLEILRHLNPNRSQAKGAAPHKPCLLLSLLDMAQDGELGSVELRRSPGLQVRFQAFSSIALPRWGGKVDVTYPFHYLRSQKFWNTFTKEGLRSESVDTTASLELDAEFLALMQDGDFRRQARIILVETYFPPLERVALYTLLGVKTQTTEFRKEMEALDKQAATMAVRQGRSARFGVQVVCGYHHTCALTGYRILTDNAESVVEAAHIEPWASTKNDDVHNGLALSRNAHWAFDRGLWSVDDDLRVIIQPARFQEWGPSEGGLGLGLGELGGRPIHFAPQTTLRPGMEYLRRHRKSWGF